MLNRVHSTGWLVLLCVVLFGTGNSTDEYRLSIWDQQSYLPAAVLGDDVTFYCYTSIYCVNVSLHALINGMDTEICSTTPNAVQCDPDSQYSLFKSRITTNGYCQYMNFILSKTQYSDSLSYYCSWDGGNTRSNLSQLHVFKPPTAARITLIDSSTVIVPGKIFPLIQCTTNCITMPCVQAITTSGTVNGASINWYPLYNTSRVMTHPQFLQVVRNTSSTLSNGTSVMTITYKVNIGRSQFYMVQPGDDISFWCYSVYYHMFAMGALSLSASAWLPLKIMAGTPAVHVLYNQTGQLKTVTLTGSQTYSITAYFGSTVGFRSYTANDPQAMYSYSFKNKTPYQGILSRDTQYYNVNLNKVGTFVMQCNAYVKMYQSGIEEPQVVQENIATVTVTVIKYTLSKNKTTNRGIATTTKKPINAKAATTTKTPMK